ncbi:MAG: TRAP transporter substrate-binding protein DctP [Flavobacteriaceae bacterium]
MTFFRRALLAAATVASFTMASLGAHAQDVTIRYSNWLPSGYFLWEKVIKPWMADVEKVTEGRVKFEVLPKLVGTVPGSYDTLMDGLADGSIVVPAYTAGRFLPHEGLELAWLGDDMVKRSAAMWHVYEKYLAPAGVFGDIKVICVFPTTTAHVFTNGAEITSADSLSGVKLRSPGQQAGKVIEAIGAVPVTKPISEVYELLNGRVIDGVVTNADSVTGFKLDGAIKVANYLEGGLASTTTMLGLSKAAWEKISEADRAAIDKISGAAFAHRMAIEHHKNQQAAMDKIVANGTKVVKVDPAIIAEYKKRTQPIFDEWYAATEKAGFKDAKAMLEDFQKVYQETPGN